jgi:hypothetical protein
MIPKFIFLLIPDDLSICCLLFSSINQHRPCLTYDINSLLANQMFHVAFPRKLEDLLCIPDSQVIFCVGSRKCINLLPYSFLTNISHKLPYGINYLLANQMFVDHHCTI